MNKLTLTDLWLVLHNMAEARAAAVAALPGGDAFQGELGDLRDKLGAIPGVRAGGRPLSVELSEADATHDTFGRALDLFLRAYEALADHLPAPINEAVAQARAQVLPTPSVFALSYQDEAIAAQRRAPALEALGDQLALLPVAELGDLREVAARFQGAGQQLQALLQERADAESAPAAQHGALRHHALALLGGHAPGARAPAAQPAPPGDRAHPRPARGPALWLPQRADPDAHPRRQRRPPGGRRPERRPPPGALNPLPLSQPRHPGPTRCGEFEA
jgi:hypothetical protein